MTDTTDMAADRRTVTFSDLVRIPLRRWPTVLVIAVLGLLCALGWLWIIPARYEAVAVVAVRPVVAEPFSYPGPGADRTVNMTVEHGLATGTRVVDAVAAATGRSPDAARAALQVELPVGTQVLRFVYTGRTATEAVDGANAASQAYLQVRGGIYEDQRTKQLTAYDEAIKAVVDRQATVRRNLPANAPRGGAQSPGVTASVEFLRSLNDQFARLTEERARLAAVDVSPGTITQVAARPVPSSHDAAPIYLVVGLLGGALVGTVSAYGQESVDRRVRSLTDAVEIVGQPTLAVVRRRSGSRSEIDLRYAALVLAERLGPGVHHVVLLASRAGEGRERLLAGLATALADQGYGSRVVDVDDVPLDSVTTVNDSGAIAGATRPGPTRRPSPRPRIPATAPVPGPVVPQAGADRPAAVGSGPQPGRPESMTAGRLMLDETASDPTDGDRPEPADQHATAAQHTTPTWATAIGTARVPTRPAAEREPDRELDREPGPDQVVERLTEPEPDPGSGLVLVDAPPAESDERGVRGARDNAAVIVVARDVTRSRDLRMLTQRLHLIGARTIGFIFLAGRG